MAIANFSFAGDTPNDLKKRQAILSFQDEDDIHCLSNVLKKQRYRVTGKSQQVAEVLELLRKHKKGIFFLDFDIEKLGSFDFISKARALHPDFKIIIAAKTMNKEEIQSAKKLGIAGFLAKPLTADAVGKLLSKPIFN